MKRAYGRNIPAPLPAHRMLTRTNPTLPPVVDLRKWCGPIKNQQSLGSCVGHTFASAMEWICRRYLGKQPILSPLYLYAQDLIADGNFPQDAGSDGVTGCNVAIVKGCCEDSLYPDSSLKIAQPTVAQNVNAAQYRMGAYHGLAGSAVALSVLGDPVPWPVEIGFTVYESFESDATARTGIMTIPKSGERVMGGHEVACLAGGTKIPLLSGTEIEIANLEGKTAWVYSISADAGIVPGFARRIWRTGRRNITRVYLDSGECIDCTEDERFMLRDGTYLRVDGLSKGHSLMPLYRRDDEFGYEEVYVPACCQYIKTHRTIARSLYGDYGPGFVIHHKDFDKRNNEPTNLHKMTWDEHTVLHAQATELLARYAQSEDGRAKSRELMKANWANPEWRDKQLKLLHSHSLRRGRIAAQRKADRAAELIARRPFVLEKLRAIAIRNLGCSPEMSRRNIQAYNLAIANGSLQPTEKQINARKENARRLNVARWNHKVEAVEKTGKCVDVFDVEVSDYHNLALASGVFVHNCTSGYDIGQTPTLRPANCPPALLIQNSWGTGWGWEGGYFWMPLAILDMPDTDLKIVHSGHKWAA